MISLYGMMLSTTENLYEEEIWSKLSDYVSDEHDRMLFFCGRPIDSTYEDEAYSNVIFNLMKLMPLKGCISLTGSLNYYVGSDAYKTYLNQLTKAPVVSLSVPIEGACLVQCDNYIGSYEVCKHLLSHGYTRFGIINGPSYSPESDARFKGYFDALKEHNIHDFQCYEGDFSETSGYEQALKLLLHPLDAIICANDQMAMGVIRAMKEKGLSVAKDIAVVGFDDIEQVRLLELPFTTVKQPFGDMACKAFDLLKHNCHDDQKVPAQLIVRESCGCPKAFQSIEHEEQEKRFYMSKYSQSLHEYTLTLRLRSSFDQVSSHQQLYDVIDEYMKKLGGHELHLCLFEDHRQLINHAIEFNWPSRMQYAYGHRQGIRLEQQVFPTFHGLPIEVISLSDEHAFLFYPIHQNHILYGYMVTDSNTAKHRIFTSLKREITTTLSRLDLMVQIQSYTKQMEKLAETDMLTGILNRRGFFETVDIAFRQDIHAKRTPGIIFCDVNGLKKVNDHFGHEVGDQMIMDTASILSNVFKNDVLARMGGDEFVIYISECSFALLEHINLVLNERINQFNIQCNTVYQLSLEAGVACYDETIHSSLDVLIKEADQNLYTKKRFRKINF